MQLVRMVDSDMCVGKPEEVSMRGTTAVNRLCISVMVAAAVIVAPLSYGIARAEQAAGASKPQRVPGDELLGEWWTEGNEGRIQFARYRDGTYRGTTVCCEKGTKDVNNPKPELRSRSTVGIVIIWGLKYDGDGEFSGGHVYNPRDGKTYGMNVEILDKDTIKIRGFLGISLLGQSQVWKRAKKGEKP